MNRSLRDLVISHELLTMCVNYSGILQSPPLQQEELLQMYTVNHVFPVSGSIERKSFFFIDYPVSSRHSGLCLEYFLIGGKSRKIRSSRRSLAIGELLVAQVVT